MRVERERAETIAAAALEAHDISSADAVTTAEVLVSADARNKQSHGLLRLPRFIRGIKHGNVNPDGSIEVVRDAGAAAAISGGSRLGPVVACEAVGEATARADDHGVGVVGVHDSNHLGMLGYYTDVIREAGYVGIAVTNTEPAMPPHGGSESILGTNPIAVGIPSDPPFNLDMSTSSVARGTVLRAAERDNQLPEGVALNGEGIPTQDPEVALNGVIKPFGGAKGSGLAIAVEILAGGLVGAAMGSDVTGTYHTEDECTKGDLFIALDPEVLAGEGFVRRVSEFVMELKATDTAAGFDEIRLPGESSITAAASGPVTIDDDVWSEVSEATDSR